MDVLNYNRNDKFEQFRDKYHTFVYKSYKKEECDGKLKITYFFEIEGLSEFSPSWLFDNKSGKDDDATDRLIFYLGMVELISYWKCACPKKVIIEAGYICDEEIEWWKKLYFDGLGEFFYVNSIDTNPDDFMEMSSTCQSRDSGNCRKNRVYKKPVCKKEDSIHGIDIPEVLIPVGGGKDSVVTMEIISGMKNEGIVGRSNAFIINPRKATIYTAREAGYDNPVTVNRTLDKRLLDLNGRGFLNGHTPFSAIVAFASTLAAYFNGFNYVALSNESSANESTVINTAINHQYSKGFEFENGFNLYEKKFINSGVTYFSLLRPLSEFQIAWLFSRHKKYHKLFRSCNAGSKENIWCAKCPKCLFVYIILSPFLTSEELIDIFGKNMLEDEEMIENFDKLTGVVPEKPFECVGSRSEVNTAIAATITKLEHDGEKLPLLFRHYKTTLPYGKYLKGKCESDISESIEKYGNYFDEENALPDVFKQYVRKEIETLCPGLK